MGIKSRKHPTPPSAATRRIAAASLLLAVPLAHAGEPADASARTLDRIDVTAERGGHFLVPRSASPKFTQPLHDTPQTIGIIGKDLFNQQGATTLAEALRNSPGVGTFYAGENGNTSTGDAVYMRGFDTSSSIFVDGVRDLGSISRDVFNIEQIEVAKGPAGTDNGRGAPSGAINLISKQAAATTATRGALTAGSDGQRRVSADWNQALGHPGAALRFNVVGQDSDVPGRDHVANKRWGIAPSLAFGLDGHTRYFLNLLYVRQDNVPDGGVPTLGLPGYTSPDPRRPWLSGASAVAPANFYGTAHDHDDVESKMATFRVEHDFSDTLRLTNTARWGRNEQNYLLTSFMANAANLATPDPADPSTWTLARSLPTFKDQQHTLLTDQLNLRWDFATGAVRHALSTGLEAAREELRSRGTSTRGRWPAANLYQPDWAVDGLHWQHNGTGGQGRTTTWSAYAFDTLAFGDSLLLSAGLRLDRYDARYTSTAICGERRAPPCGARPAGTLVPSVDARGSGTLFNWKLAALYKANDDVSVYAHYALSQQPPGGNALELSSAANSPNNPALEPQKARTAEVGSKWNFFAQDLLVSLARFRTDVSNEIAPDPTNPNLYQQTGAKRVQGLELSAVGHLGERWALSAGYTKMQAQVKRGPTVAQDGSADLAYTPDDALTAWATYTLPAGPGFGGGVRHNGPMKRGSSSALGTPDRVDSSTVWDAVVRFPLGEHLDLRLNAYNLFNERYVSALNKSGFRYTPGMPRTYTFTVDWRF